MTLLGDAAHAMTPNLGQGASQAIEDAVVLAGAVSCLGVTVGLAAYEGARRARARSFVQRARRLGAFIQWSNPVVCWARDVGIAWTPASVVKRQLAVTYGVHVLELCPA